MARVRFKGLRMKVCLLALKSLYRSRCQKRKSDAVNLATGLSTLDPTHRKLQLRHSEGKLLMLDYGISHKGLDDT
jgi:hypothetical protein